MNKEAINVLLVEDNPGDARLVQEILREQGGTDFIFKHFTTLSESINFLATCNVDVILLDLSLPDSNGLNTISKMRRHSTDTPILVLTGKDSEELGIKAVALGAQDYLVKGLISGASISRSIQYAIERKRVELERFRKLLNRSNESIFVLEVPSGNLVDVNETAENMLEISKDKLLTMSLQDIVTESAWDRMNYLFTLNGSDIGASSTIETTLKGKIPKPIEMTVGHDTFDGTVYAVAVARDITERKRSEEQLKQSFADFQKALEGTINAIAMTIEMRDPYTSGHQQRVTELALAIGHEMKLNDDQLMGIRLAGPIHDIGKIYTPAEILIKPGHLSQIEFDIIKTHPKVGYDILKNMDFPWPIAQIVYQHHERIDGSGYPLKLKGDAILLEAKIVGISDVVETMASHRPYRPALGLDKALEEVRKNRGILYDPEVVDICLMLFSDDRFSFTKVDAKMN